LFGMVGLDETGDSGSTDHLRSVWPTGAKRRRPTGNRVGSNNTLGLSTPVTPTQQKFLQRGMRARHSYG